MQTQLRVFKKALELKTPSKGGKTSFLGVAQFPLEPDGFPRSWALRKGNSPPYPKDANAWMWLGVVELEKGDGQGACGCAR